MPTHRHIIGQCNCGAYLYCQTDGRTYEGSAYWVGGDPYCLHVVEGCEFDDLDLLDSMIAKINQYSEMIKKIDLIRNLEKISFAGGGEK